MVCFSALMELRCTMEVDMKHIRSGLSVNSKIHMDAPASLSINLDPEVSKLLMKVRDEVNFDVFFSSAMCNLNF